MPIKHLKGCWKHFCLWVSGWVQDFLQTPHSHFTFSFKKSPFDLYKELVRCHKTTINPYQKNHWHRWMSKIIILQYGRFNAVRRIADTISNLQRRLATEKSLVSVGFQNFRNFTNLFQSFSFWIWKLSDFPNSHGKPLQRWGGGCSNFLSCLVPGKQQRWWQHIFWRKVLNRLEKYSKSVQKCRHHISVTIDTLIRPWPRCCKNWWYCWWPFFVCWKVIILLWGWWPS